MRIISTFEAKNKLSRVIAAAEKGELQIITKNGKEIAVVISYEEFRRLTTKRESLSDFLLKSSLRNSKIDLERNQDTDRSTLNFSE